MRGSRLPSLVLVLWTTATLSWWAFAFMPLPASPPAWLAAARYACFGAVDSGLPRAEGWLLLALAPATFLVAILVLWGSELATSLRALGRSRPGQVVLAALAVGLVVEGTWVTARFRTAQRVANWAAEPLASGKEIPADYPRQTALAPGFTLIDQRGDSISLARFTGRPVVLAFVFAHCETLCPLVVETLKHACPDAAAGEVLLVTLDPWRDTVGVLPGVARRWELPRNFHVLSSHRVDDVLAVVRAYGVPFQRDERSGTIVHPSLVFLIDAQGRSAYTFNDPPVTWVREGLRRLG